MIEHQPKMEIYTKTKIKREYGWTDKCMQYLPEPNKTWYGRYKSQKFPAWTKDLVDQTNARPEVQKILRWKNDMRKTGQRVQHKQRKRKSTRRSQRSVRSKYK